MMNFRIGGLSQKSTGGVLLSGAIIGVVGGAIYMFVRWFRSKDGGVY